MQSFSLLILINVHVSFFFLHHHRVQLEVPLYSLQIQRNAIEKFLFLVSTVKHIKYNRERLSAPTIPSWLLAHDGDYFRHLRLVDFLRYLKSALPALTQISNLKLNHKRSTR